MSEPEEKCHRTLYMCQKCGEEFGEGEQNNGMCPHCMKGQGDPIGCCEGDGCE